MEILIFVILAVVFLEVTFLVVRNIMKKPIAVNGKRKLYVDSSALMDGRILKVAESGFLADNLIIPRSVVREMQLVADGKDPDKRSRARAGIDLVNELERVVYVDVEILQDALDRTPVDERLMALAKENHGAIITNDYNLEKVAETEGIDVLNVNNLCTMLQSDLKPGEQLKILVQTAGHNPKQGIGYTNDGVIMVIENAKKFIGQVVDVEFVRQKQTSTGRMYFAKIVPGQEPAKKAEPKKKSAEKSKK